MKARSTWFRASTAALLVACGTLLAGESPIKEDVQRGTKVSAKKMKEFGQVLTDEQGRALYVLKEDSHDKISCYDACARTWPPLLAARGEPEADDKAVKDELLDTVKRDDGHLQVTYQDRPLYYYVEDEDEQNATGHEVTDVWGEWSLVSPQGEPLENGQGERQNVAHKGNDEGN